ncbi:MAG: P-loop NTPase fold protein [Candidatus Aminicenantes bacterium]|nr:P-loop NTPase fold protein [Candidatus Aminicenantes bacterium]
MKLRALDPLLYPVDKDIIHNENSFIEHFYQLITRSIQPPYVVSIDGLWGTGKTTVMKILQDKLEKSGFPVFWFNPWEYRQTESVVLAFLQCLAAENKSFLKETKKSGKKILRVLLESGLDVGLKMVTKNNLSLKDIKDGLESTEEVQSPSHEKYENTIEAIKKEFVALIDGISKKHDNNPVVIFFDDLDRCLPDDSIQLLEALKNLFVTKGSKCIFICGIDTRIAKQFISTHYNGIEEMFAINYFRKIFNLTISMPFSSNIYDMLLKYIKEQYEWEDPGEEKSKSLARMVTEAGLQAEIFSRRKYLNIIDNFNVFRKFNPDYNFTPAKDFIVHLLVLKEALQPVYEELIQGALKNRDKTISQLISGLTSIAANKGKPRPEYKGEFFVEYFKKEANFGNEYLYKWMVKHPTLA